MFLSALSESKLFQENSAQPARVYGTPPWNNRGVQSEEVQFP